MCSGALDLWAVSVPRDAGSGAAPGSVGRIEAAGGLDYQVAEALRVEPGAAQHRRHHLVVDQLVEGGLIAAAIGASGHVPLLTSGLLSTIIPKDVVIVTRVRKLNGNLPIGSPELPRRWNRSRRLPACSLAGCGCFYAGSLAAIPGDGAGRPV